MDDLDNFDVFETFLGLADGFAAFTFCGLGKLFLSWVNVPLFFKHLIIKSTGTGSYSSSKSLASHLRAVASC